MKDRTKEILRDGFGCLVSNASAISGAKNGPLWLTIVMFFLSIFLPVIPIFTAQLRVAGSTFISNYSYGLERYVSTVATNLKDEGYKFIVSEDDLLSITKDGASINYDEYGSNKPLAAYIDNGNGEDSSKGQYDFILYVSNTTVSKEKTTLINALKAKSFLANSTKETDQNDVVYKSSFMVLFPNSLSVFIYGRDTTTLVAASYTGDYKTMTPGVEGLDYLLTVKEKDGTVIEKNLLNKNYIDGVFKNFKVIMNKAYDTLKVRNVLMQSGLYAGVFTGVILLLGFLMWVLTRGKKNPNNYFSVWLTMQVSARLAPAPAIITLIMGFFLTNYTPIIFILLMGLRVMWISMKELRPIVQ